MILVNPDLFVGNELQGTAADYPQRQLLAELGVRFVLESAITKWSIEGAENLFFWMEFCNSLKQIRWCLLHQTLRKILSHLNFRIPDSM